MQNNILYYDFLYKFYLAINNFLILIIWFYHWQL